uniref:ANK_REP_REGION domain-containing protein n=2 Tax=Macrostomum lignano TaxID=282301 RepID=A0A1I8FXL5_9PLAT
ADPNDKDEICFLAAKSSASHSRLKCFQLLVQTVADQKQRSQCCMRSEVFANDENKLSSVKRLVQAAGANGFKDQFCMEVASAINYFSGPEPPKELQYLIDAVSSHQVRDFYCIEAAKRAASGRNWKLVKCLLQTIADSAIAKDFCLQVGETAAKDGHVEILKEILDRETSANKKLLSRRKCAMAACSRLHEHIVAYLGLEPDWLFQYSTILSFTAAMAIEGRNSVLNDTLSRMQPARITQLLRLSISQRHVALAVTLINDERVSTEHVDLPDSTGATALMLAADAGHHELIEKLIDLGASVRAEDSQGRTALSRACEAGHVRAAKALMDRGADASHRDGRSLTCGQLAEQFGHSQQLMQLISGQSEKPKCQKFFNLMM